MSGVKTIKHRTELIMKNTRIYNFDKLDQISDLLNMNLKYSKGSYVDLLDCTRYFDWEIVEMLDDLSYEDVAAVLFTSRDKAHKALDFIIDSNGGLTDYQIEALRQLIDGGFLEAIDNCTLKLHN